MSLTAKPRIAYLILAHRYPEQLVRLVSRLNTESAVFLIHIDKKVSNAIYDSIVHQLSLHKNVYFIKRYTCYWAGFGIVEACIQGIKELIDQKIDFDFLALLSGQDYPIKSNEYIESFFKKNIGTSFIHHNPFPFSEWGEEKGGWNRVNYWHLVRESRQYSYSTRNNFASGTISQRLLNRGINACAKLLPLTREFPNSFHPYGGAQFWCLYKTHVQQAYNTIQHNPQLVKFFRHVFVPDEIFFQTIAGNSSFKNNIHNDTLTFLEWYRPGAILYASDMINILKSEHLFARKFDTTVDAEVLDMIDTQILFKS
ncbi:beta-1,6-N-acetylglucosaminyltransferase [Hymenobacter norwichensis]|uniref:beta-1,6-N-acetylglucosaminyltransferase n=1 Tax=Hymenobacter norwichensis TaxID=223903 RepID=UPI0003B7983C|nr:beta-1,6-N-acetylglucosaminyltransferase [Hymenobacter norwichensis]